MTVRAIQHAWRHWQEEADWEQVYRFHAARHYAITRMAERIGNPLIVKALAGHQSISTTQRYAHLECRDVSQRARDIMEALNSVPDSVV